jgi:hypothetical protein
VSGKPHDQYKSKLSILIKTRVIGIWVNQNGRQFKEDLISECCTCEINRQGCNISYSSFLRRPINPAEYCYYQRWSRKSCPYTLLFWRGVMPYSAEWQDDLMNSELERMLKEATVSWDNIPAFVWRDRKITTLFKTGEWLSQFRFGWPLDLKSETLLPNGLHTQKSRK